MTVSIHGYIFILNLEPYACKFHEKDYNTLYGLKLKKKERTVTHGKIRQELL
jgi:hypothetical protein